MWTFCTVLFRNDASFQNNYNTDSEPLNPDPLNSSSTKDHINSQKTSTYFKTVLVSCDWIAGTAAFAQILICVGTLFSPKYVS